MRRSILLGLVIALLVVGVVGFGMVRGDTRDALRENLNQEFDEGLLGKARAFAPLVEYERGRYEFDAQQDAPSALPPYYEVRTPDGETLAWSGRERLAIPEAGGGLEPVFWDAAAKDGDALRVVMVRVQATLEGSHEHDDDDDEHGGSERRERLAPGGENTAVGVARPAQAYAHVVVAASRARVDARIAAVSGTMDDSLLLLGLFMLIAAGSAVFVTWSALRGVTKNVREASAAGLGPIAWDPRPPRELRPLTDALDGALAEAGAAVARERDVIAGMAHELRTPVAELLTTTEIALARPGDDHSVRPALVDVREVALRMKTTVETMLTVARGRAPTDTSRLQDVDVVALWTDVAAAAEAKNPRRRVAFSCSGPETAAASCDAGALRIVLTTLAENAAHYAPREAQVEAEVSVRADRVVLRVVNPAPHLDAADIPHLTEPLWRRGARNDAPEGLGLGLYLASEVARHAGFELDLALRDGRITASVVVPRDASQK